MELKGLRHNNVCKYMDSFLSWDSEVGSTHPHTHTHTHTHSPTPTPTPTHATHPHPHMQHTHTHTCNTPTPTHATHTHATHTHADPQVVRLWEHHTSPARARRTVTEGGGVHVPSPYFLFNFCSEWKLGLGMCLGC